MQCCVRVKKNRDAEHFEGIYLSESCISSGKPDETFLCQNKHLVWVEGKKSKTVMQIPDKKLNLKVPKFPTVNVIYNIKLHLVLNTFQCFSHVDKVASKSLISDQQFGFLLVFVQINNFGPPFFYSVDLKKKTPNEFG